MSRFRRLKDRRRKNRIKATSYGLALALAVGSAQGLGTYALFTDTEKVPSDLAISTGDVDIEANTGFNKIDVKSGDEFNHKIIISNKGTLKQNIGIGLDSSVDWIDFKIDFIDEQIKDIDKLSTTPQSINSNNGGLIILEPNTNIEANIIVKVGTVPKEAENKNMSFNIKYYASQTNKENSVVYSGFYDIDIQTNTIQFGEQNIIVDGDGMKVAGNGNPDRQYIEVYHTKDFNPIPKSIEFVSGEGLFESAKVEYKNDDKFEIQAHIYNTDLKEYKFKDNFGTDKIIIKFIYDNITKEIEFDFRKPKNPSGNRHAEAKYTILKEYETIKSKLEEVELEEIELPKEEIEKPNEPEVVEPPKEEIEKSSEPEVIEPPKEEVEKPNEPEAIEPPKENEEIQE